MPQFAGASSSAGWVNTHGTGGTSREQFHGSLVDLPEEIQGPSLKWGLHLPEGHP